MKYKIKDLIKHGDIIPNVANTYPQNAFNAESAEKFYEYLEKYNCSMLCYHISRLTKQEIHSIKRTGLSSGSKALFLQKIKNSPECCDWFKSELLKQYVFLMGF